MCSDSGCKRGSPNGPYHTAFPNGSRPRRSPYWPKKPSRCLPTGVGAVKTFVYSQSVNFFSVTGRSQGFLLRFMAGAKQAWPRRRNRGHAQLRVPTDLPQNDPSIQQNLREIDPKITRNQCDAKEARPALRPGLSVGGGRAGSSYRGLPTPAGGLGSAQQAGAPTGLRCWQVSSL